MHAHRIRNKILQYLYRPGPSRRGRLSGSLPELFPAETLDAIEQAIEQKITPLLSGLWKE